MKIPTATPLKQIAAIASTACAILLTSPYAQAAGLSYGNNWNYIAPPGVTLDGIDYYASTTDLANTGQPTLLSTEWSGGTEGAYGSSPAELNNGLYAPSELSAGNPNGFVNASPTDSTLLATPNTTYTINFTGGMDITSVDVYAAMTGADRAKQNWKLEYRTAGSSSYTAIVDPNLALNVAQNSNGNRQGAWYNKVTLTVGEGELVNVESLRFTFLEPVYFAPTDGSNSIMLETGYREIDVLGTPSPLPPPLQAELTYGNNWNYIAPPGVTLDGADYYASTTDLANTGQPTLLSAEWSGGTEGAYGSSPAQLNNGLYAPSELSAGNPNGFVNASPTDSTLLATPNTTYTINFTGGMDITSVDVYAAMTGTERAKQNWKLEYRTVGSASYTVAVDPNLALNVAQNSNGNRQGAWYNKVTLTVAEGELVNVESLRFTFLEPVYYEPTDGSNSIMLQTGYREIDVFGTPSPFPPPDYDAWAVGYGLDPAVSSGPNAGTPEADPDGDSFTNASEFAFGTSPIVGNGGLLQMGSGVGTLAIAWLERSGSGIIYRVQQTADLVNGPWSDSALVPISPGYPAPEGYEWRQVSVATGAGKGFYRVTASF